MSDTTDPRALAEQALEYDEKATPGPWDVSGISPAGGMHRADLRMLNEAGVMRRTRWRTGEFFFHTEESPRDDPEDGHPEPCCDCGSTADVYRQEETDMRFAAFARTALPALAREVLRLHVFGPYHEEEARTLRRLLTDSEGARRLAEARLENLGVVAQERQETAERWRARAEAAERELHEFREQAQSMKALVDWGTNIHCGQHTAATQPHKPSQTASCWECFAETLECATRAERERDVARETLRKVDEQHCRSVSHHGETLCALQTVSEEARRLREALAELVALKDLKDRIEASEPQCWKTQAENAKRREADIQEYLRRKPAAWAAARAALAQDPASERRCERCDALKEAGDHLRDLANTPLLKNPVPDVALSEAIRAWDALSPADHECPGPDISPNGEPCAECGWRCGVPLPRHRQRAGMRLHADLLHGAEVLMPAEQREKEED